MHHLLPIPNPTHRKFLFLTKYLHMLFLVTHFDTGRKEKQAVSSNQREAHGPIFLMTLTVTFCWEVTFQQKYFRLIENLSSGVKFKERGSWGEGGATVIH